MRYSLKSVKQLEELEIDMPIKEDLLEILCCPKSMERLEVVPPDGVASINERIAAGQVKYESGSPVQDPLQEALITVDAQRIYAIKDSIPVMLIDESIPTAQLGDELTGQLAPTSS